MDTVVKIVYDENRYAIGIAPIKRVREREGEGNYGKVDWFSCEYWILSSKQFSAIKLKQINLSRERSFERI